MANDPNPGLFGGFQLPGLQMPAFTQTSLADNPVMSTLTGSMDFMKNLWGASGNSLGSIAGLVAPTLDIEQLDRKITDLKAVEGWLHANASMLRATIQALEVQRNTIATLQSFSNLAAQQAQSSTTMPSATQAAASANSGSAFVSPTWPMPHDGAPSTRDAGQRERVPEPDPDAMSDPDDEFDAEMPADVAAPAVEPKTEPRHAARLGKHTPPDAAANADALRQSAEQATNASIQNAAAWWNLLQDQFAKVAHAAAAGTKQAAAVPPKRAAKPTTKPEPVAKQAAKKSTAKQTAFKQTTGKQTTAKSVAKPSGAKPAKRKSGSRP